MDGPTVLEILKKLHGKNLITMVVGRGGGDGGGHRLWWRR